MAHTVQAKKFPYMEYSRATSKTITTTVRGLGNTGAAAYADAIRQAREISGGSYVDLRPENFIQHQLAVDCRVSNDPSWENQYDS